MKKTARTTYLRQLLLGRRRDLDDDVQRRIRDGRAERSIDVHEELERIDADGSDDVEFALMQMKAETMRSIDAALVRLAAGDYGSCFECHAEISETRLKALPFAVRCRDCEERREQGQARTRKLAQQNASISLFQR